MNKIYKFFFLFILFPFSLFAQDLSITCDMTAGIPSTPYATTGGRFKPSANAQGQYFRVLIVFAEFEGDNNVISNWQYKSKPDWANNIIDQTSSSSYRSNTISDYFKKMSNGTFDVIGDIYDSVITVPTHQSYGSANNYVLGKLNSYNCNFKKYDNWGFNGTNFVFSAQNGDGYVDMIYIIYRWGDNSRYTGWFNLPGAIANLNFSPEITTHDGVKINGGYSVSTISSGITLNCKGSVYDSFTIVSNFAHELGHYLFGAGHTNFGGIMAGEPYTYYTETFAMSGWERSLLGYTSFIVPASDGQLITLRDYVTTGDVIKIPVPFTDPNSNKYLIIENHQRLSSYDQIMRGGSLNGTWDPNATLGKGLYIWTFIDGSSYPSQSIDIKSANGAWDWTYEGDYYAGPGWYSGEPYEGYLPETKRTAVDRDNGESGRYPDHIYWNNIWSPKWVDINPLTNQYEITRDVMGREYDAFNMGYNEILSPWSNPSSYLSGVSNIAVELMSQNGSNLVVKICTSNSTALGLPPSKPQFLKTSFTLDGHMSLNWTANTEPDLSSYKIYKAITTGAEPSSYTYVTTVSSSSTTWTDPTINTQNGFTRVFYKTSAVDNSSQESVKSDYSVINCLNGTINSNTTLPTGITYINSDIILPDVYTLSIPQGTTLYFTTAGNEFIMDGQLSVTGTSGRPVTFTSSNSTAGSWGPIFINGSGANGSTLQYANIQYGTEIDVINANNVSIQNCSITNSSMHGITFSGSTNSNVLNNTISNSNTAHGIYIQNGSNVTCTGNVIKRTNSNHNGVGIYFGGGGTGIATQNDISGFSWGICAIWGSSPTSQHATGVSRNNRITNCIVGIDTYYNSYPIFGIPSANDVYGGNSIYNNTSNVSVGISYPNNSSSLYACHNWWGSNPPNTSLFSVGSGSYFYYLGYASSDPWAGVPLPSISQITNVVAVSNNEVSKSVSTGNNSGNTIVTFEDSNGQSGNTKVTIYTPEISDSLIPGINFRTLKENAEAKNFFISYLKKHPDNQAAYVYLYSTADSNTTPDLINYFRSLPNQSSKAQKLLLSYLYMKQNKTDSAKIVNNNIIVDNPNTPLAVKAMLNNFYIELYNNNDKNSAADILNQIKNQSDLSTDIEISMADNALNLYGTLLAKKSNILVKKQAINDDESAPEPFGLSNNYPNPFNPTTVIEYQLPKDGFVTLKVYDILGREVKTLVNGFRTKGKYTTIFDGSNLASGIYFYQLRANGFSSIKKMILTK
ncbi:MAG: right-handed parallel beta-helix repeat-containing protein [Ignavibacteriaceae bacterium]|nr:right-handed parallel beta-helix repeat-containing protein [Ignavibacteriaceae bacterium]